MLADSFQRSLQQIAADALKLIAIRYAPASVIVDEHAEIVQTLGATGPFLEIPSGPPSLNLLKLARDGQMASIQRLLKASKKSEGFGEIDIDVQPIKGTMQSRCFLVTFVEHWIVEIPASKTKGGKGAAAAKLNRLAPALIAELESTKEYLKTVIHDYEASAEELQSTNEELTTVNQEMHNRNQELSEAIGDLNNLLTIVQLPIIMVGSDLTIRNQNPSAENILNILSSDIGRPITDISMKIPVHEVEKMILASLKSESGSERQSRHRDGKNYILRVCPYRTPGNKVGGAVLILMETHPNKKKSRP